MNPAARLLVIAAALALAFTIAWLARRGVALRRHPASLPTGLVAPVLFTSETCSTCAQVRRTLEGLDVAGLTEVIWEKQPSVFEQAGITRVPVFVWSDRDGSTWRVDGVAGVGRLKRWLEGP